MISKRQKYLIISIIVLIGAFFTWRLFFDNSIRLSKPQGFYEEEFDLKLSTKWGVDLYYTLDGSEPTVDSIRYDQPIHIYDVSDNENVYSMEDEITVYYREDLTGQKNPYKSPDYKIDKCIPLRVASFDKNGNKIIETFQTYWVGFGDKEGYEDLYTVSLITDSSNLFDYENGIYVNGKDLDKYVEKGKLSKVLHGWKTNYSRSGIDSEKPMYFSVYSPEKKLLFESQGGLRVQGKGSRKNTQKSFALIAREEETGIDKFQTRIFERKDGTRKIKLFAGGQDEVVKLKDWLVSSIVSNSDLKIATQKMLPASLFLDGEYWGTYYLLETYNKDYVNAYYGIDEDNVIIINAGSLEEGEDGDKEQYYDNAYQFVRQYGAEDGMLDFIAEHYYDLDSFVDYYALEIFLGNGDWPKNNRACWRARETSSGEYNDGKFRWMLYDVNYVGVLNDCDNDALEHCLERDAVFHAMMKNPVFQEKFRDRVIYISEELFSEENIDHYVEPWLEIMEKPLEKSSMRFFGEKRTEQISEEIYEIKDYCSKRESVLLSQIQLVCDGNCDNADGEESELSGEDYEYSFYSP